MNAVEQDCPPSWHDREADPGTKTVSSLPLCMCINDSAFPQGTLAFMSSEIIEDRPYFSVPSNFAKHCVHTVIHDIESFFWVLIYLCLTRKGPGGARRDELDNELPSTASQAEIDQARRLLDVVHCLFDCQHAGLIARTKSNLFRGITNFETTVLDLIHPYFNRLKHLLSEWWRLLQITYRFYDEVAQATLHDTILGFLDEELAQLKMTGSETAEERAASDLMKAEVERRERDLARYAAFPDEPKDPSVPSSSPGKSLPPKSLASSRRIKRPPVSRDPTSSTPARASKRLRKMKEGDAGKE